MNGAIGTNLTGGGGLVKEGGGTVTLSGSNTFSGGVQVAAGSLIISSAGGLPAGSDLTVGTFPAAGSIVAASIAAASTNRPAVLVPQTSTSMVASRVVAASPSRAAAVEYAVATAASGPALRQVQSARDAVFAARQGFLPSRGVAWPWAVSMPSTARTVSQQHPSAASIDKLMEMGAFGRLPEE